MAALAPGIVVKVGILYSKAALLKYASSWRACEPIGVLIINTPIGSQALHDDAYLRRAALEYNIPTFTTIPGAKAAIKAIKALQCNKINTYSLQEIHNY